MYSCPSILVLNLFIALFCGALPRASDASPIADNKPIDITKLLIDVLRNAVREDVVRVDHYYESLCPDCIAEYPEILEVVMQFQHRIDLRTYPFGNARMTDDNGKITIECQHGEKECYGNKLHACAIDQLKDFEAYVPFINCLMVNGSDDLQTDTCGKDLKINVQNIKSCAKGNKGEELLEYYGKESRKVSYPGVPYHLVNGQEVAENDTLFEAICAAYIKPPEICNELHDIVPVTATSELQCKA